MSDTSFCPLAYVARNGKVAAEDACKIEHDISEESFQAPSIL